METNITANTCDQITPYRDDVIIYVDFPASQSFILFLIDWTAWFEWLLSKRSLCAPPIDQWSTQTANIPTTMIKPTYCQLYVYIWDETRCFYAPVNTHGGGGENVVRDTDRPPNVRQTQPHCLIIYLILTFTGKSHSWNDNRKPGVSPPPPRIVGLYYVQRLVAPCSRLECSMVECDSMTSRWRW